MSYVNFEVPEELEKKTLELITKIAEKGKLKKGMNETTKSIERQKAKFVVIAANVDPPELVYHIPLICDEKNVPYIFVKTKEDLGKAAKLEVACSSLSVIKVPRELEAELQDIISKIKALRK